MSATKMEDSLVLSIVLPKGRSKGQGAKRIRVRIPAHAFEDEEDIGEDKGQALTQVIDQAFEDIKDGVVPDSTSRLVPAALYVLVNNDLISQEEYEDCIAVLGRPEASHALRAGEEQGGSAKKSAKKSTKRSAKVAFEEEDEEESDEEDEEMPSADDDEEGDEEDEEDPYLVTVEILSGEIAGGRDALDQFFASLEDPEDIANVAEMLQIFVEWLNLSPAEAKKSDEAKDNPWLLEFFTQIIKSKQSKAQAQKTLEGALALAEDYLEAEDGEFEDEEDFEEEDDEEDLEEDEEEDEEDFEEGSDEW